MMGRFALLEENIPAVDTIGDVRRLAFSNSLFGYKIRILRIGDGSVAAIAAASVVLIVVRQRLQRYADVLGQIPYRLADICFAAGGAGIKDAKGLFAAAAADLPFLQNLKQRNDRYFRKIFFKMLQAGHTAHNHGRLSQTSPLVSDFLKAQVEFGPVAGPKLGNSAAAEEHGRIRMLVEQRIVNFNDQLRLRRAQLTTGE